MERALRLEREASTFSTEEALELLRRGRLFPEEQRDEARLNPTADIASRVREAQVEIIRISKISNNLKGDLQRALRVQAALTMGLVDILRTRADDNGQKTGEEEVRRLREQVEKLSKAQEHTDEKISSMKSELNDAKVRAKLEREKREKTTKALKDALARTADLKRQIKEEESKHLRDLERVKAMTIRERCVEPELEPEPMEVELLPTLPTAEDVRVSSPHGRQGL